MVKEYEKFIESIAEERRALVVSGYPPSLAKAVFDEFDYACRLTIGEILRFTSATPMGEFVKLTLKSAENDYPGAFPRGLEVRISAIVWCADAPDAS